MKISRENLEKYIGELDGLTSGYIAVTKKQLMFTTGLGTGVFEMSAFGDQMLLQQRYFTDIIGITDGRSRRITRICCVIESERK
jgi:hypothetical protein